MTMASLGTYDQFRQSIAIRNGAQCWVGRVLQTYNLAGCSTVREDLIMNELEET